MGDQQAHSAVFPSPPPFYKHFTKHNIARLRHVRRGAQSATTERDSTNNGAQLPDHGVLSLPPELRYLVPPPPPQPGHALKAYGQEVELNPGRRTLADLDIEQLYQSDSSAGLNPQPHLLALVRSMLTSFLALAGVLSQNPQLYEAQSQGLQTIAFNIHDLINQYRPHQARHSLITLLEDRIDETKSEIARIEASSDKVGKMLRTLQSNDWEVSPNRQGTERQEPVQGTEDCAMKRAARQQAAWAALEDGLK